MRSSPIQKSRHDWSKEINALVAAVANDRLPGGTPRFTTREKFALIVPITWGPPPENTHNEMEGMLADEDGTINFWMRGDLKTSECLFYWAHPGMFLPAIIEAEVQEAAFKSEKSCARAGYPSRSHLVFRDSEAPVVISAKAVMGSWMYFLDREGVPQIGGTGTFRDVGRTISYVWEGLTHSITFTRRKG